MKNFHSQSHCNYFFPVFYPSLFPHHTKSAIIGKLKIEEQNKSNKETDKNVKKFDATKLSIRITRMKKINKEPVIVRCEIEWRLSSKDSKRIEKSFEIPVPKGKQKRLQKQREILIDNKRTKCCKIKYNLRKNNKTSDKISL